MEILIWHLFMFNNILTNRFLVWDMDFIELWMLSQNVNKTQNKWEWEKVVLHGGYTSGRNILCHGIMQNWTKFLQNWCIIKWCEESQSVNTNVIRYFVFYRFFFWKKRLFSKYLRNKPLNIFTLLSKEL